MDSNPRLTWTHWVNIALAGVAFTFFFANQVNVLGGQELNLTAGAGRFLLSGFLGIGIIAQLAKFPVGHKHWLEVVFTSVLLLSHIAAELMIWFGTQVFGITLPENLPQWIIGLYWLLGPIEIIGVFGRRELQLFKGESQQQQQQRQLAEAKERQHQLELAAVREQALRQGAEKLAEQLAGQAYTGKSGNSQAIAEQKEVQTECPDCGKIITAPTDRRLTYALNGHKAHCPGAPAASPNGRRDAAVTEED